MAEETEPNKDNESKNEINPNTGGKEKISVFNYILVFLIVISLIVLLYRYYVYSPDRQEEFELKLPFTGPARRV
jgi:hypothetical protein